MKSGSGGLTPATCCQNDEPRPLTAFTSSRLNTDNHPLTDKFTFHTKHPKLIETQANFSSFFHPLLSSMHKVPYLVYTRCQKSKELCNMYSQFVKSFCMSTLWPFPPCVPVILFYPPVLSGMGSNGLEWLSDCFLIGAAITCGSGPDMTRPSDKGPRSVLKVAPYYTTNTLITRDARDKLQALNGHLSLYLTIYLSPNLLIHLQPVSLVSFCPFEGTIYQIRPSGERAGGYRWCDLHALQERPEKAPLRYALAPF